MRDGNFVHQSGTYLRRSNRVTPGSRSWAIPGWAWTYVKSEAVLSHWECAFVIEISYFTEKSHVCMFGSCFGWNLDKEKLFQAQPSHVRFRISPFYTRIWVILRKVTNFNIKKHDHTKCFFVQSWSTDGLRTCPWMYFHHLAQVMYDRGGGGGGGVWKFSEPHWKFHIMVGRNEVNSLILPPISSSYGKLPGRLW